MGKSTLPQSAAPTAPLLPPSLRDASLKEGGITGAFSLSAKASLSEGGVSELVSLTEGAAFAHVYQDFTQINALQSNPHPLLACP